MPIAFLFLRAFEDVSIRANPYDKFGRVGAPLKKPLREPREDFAMPTCRECGDEVEQLVSVKIGGKAKKLCEDCADRARENEQVAEESEAVVQQMMGFKGRR
jgi:hypothetical protein